MAQRVLRQHVGGVSGARLPQDRLARGADRRHCGPCRQDHATAIAHDLEDALWEEVEVVRRGRTVKEWRAKDLSAAELTEIITAVKARVG